MHGYSKWEWRILEVGLFSMTGMALLSMTVGFVGMALENWTTILAGAGGLALAAAIGGATIIILQITGRRRSQGTGTGRNAGRCRAHSRHPV